jgi:ribonuclease E
VPALGLGLLRQITFQVAQSQLKEVRALLPPEVATFLLNQKRKEISVLEEKHRLKIHLTPKPGLLPEEIQMEFIKLEPEAGGNKGEVKETSTCAAS